MYKRQVPFLSPTEQALSESERASAALKLKDEGNSHFVQGKYEEAKECYSHAIALDPTKAVFWSNRAACDIKLEQQGLAIADASALLLTCACAHHRPKLCQGILPPRVCPPGYP